MTAAGVRNERDLIVLANRYTPSLTNKAQTMRAVLLARATVTSILGLRASTRQQLTRWNAGLPKGRRSQVETAIGRCQHLISSKLRSRTLIAQEGEAAIEIGVLARMNRLAKAASIRCD